MSKGKLSETDEETRWTWASGLRVPQIMKRFVIEPRTPNHLPAGEPLFLIVLELERHLVSDDPSTKLGFELRAKTVSLTGVCPIYLTPKACMTPGANISWALRCGLYFPVRGR